MRVDYCVGDGFSVSTGELVSAEHRSHGRFQAKELKEHKQGPHNHKQLEEAAV